MDRKKANAKKLDKNADRMGESLLYYFEKRGVEEIVMKKWKIVLILACSFTLSGCTKPQKSTENIDQGNLSLEKGYYQEALTNFQSALNAEEDLVQAYRGAGIAYMGIEDYSSAVEAFKNALTATKANETEVIQDIRLYKAASEYSMKDYEACKVTCAELLAVEKLWEAYYLRGACEMVAGEERQARTDFDMAVSLNPNDYELYLNIYEVYKEQNLSSNGGKYLEEALAIGGSDAEDLYQRGKIYYYLENYEKAKEQLANAAVQSHGSSILLLSQVNIETNDIESAEQLAQQYLREIGETPQVYNVIALVYIAQENYDAALEQIQKGLALDMEEGKQDLLFNEIVVYEKKHDFQTAKEKAEVYMSMYPYDKQAEREYEFLSTR